MRVLRSVLQASQPLQARLARPPHPEEALRVRPAPLRRSAHARLHRQILDVPQVDVVGGCRRRRSGDQSGCNSAREGALQYAVQGLAALWRWLLVRRGGAAGVLAVGDVVVQGRSGGSGVRPPLHCIHVVRFGGARQDNQL